MTDEDLLTHLRRVEKVRKSYKPEPIATLFVGESAPVGRKFFYFGNSGMTTYMRRAIENAYGPWEGDLLERFKSFCWYLDDLVLVKLGVAARKAVSLVESKRISPKQL